jgi:glycine/D-amino acid oxidase-like deaminating enzyme
VRLADGRRLPAARVVVAAGAETVALVPGAPVRRRKGHLLITDRYPGYVRHQLVELGYLRSAHGGDRDSVAFNAQPRRTGQVLIGSSRQFDDHDPAVSAAMVDRIARRAQRFLPGIGGLDVIRCWTGMRPATPDHLPLIGRSAGGLWLATGHEGLGITTATATGALLADLVRGRPTAIPAAPYRPDRFLETAVHD